MLPITFVWNQQAHTKSVHLQHNSYALTIVFMFSKYFGYFDNTYIHYADFPSKKSVQKIWKIPSGPENWFLIGCK